MVGKHGAWIFEVTGHIAALVRKSSQMVVLSFLSLSPFFIQSRVSTPEISWLIFRVGLSFSVKGLWKHSHSHIQKCVS